LSQSLGEGYWEFTTATSKVLNANNADICKIGTKIFNKVS